MKKVLFISTSFYPLNAVSTLRVGQWSKYLAKKGYKVIVLTTKKYPFMGKLDLKENLPSNVIVKEVDFLPTFLKFVKKEKSSSIKSDISKLNNIRFFVRRLRNYIGSMFEMHDLWINKALKEAITIVENEKIDFVISSFSPPAVHILAHKLKQKYPYLKWIADFRDLWAYNHILSAKGIFGVYERYREKKVLSNSDCIITVSSPLSKIMQDIYPDKKVFTIENGFDPEEFHNWQSNLVPFPKIENKIVISYLGTIYPKTRDPSILFEAVNELIEEDILSKEQIEINFYGDNKKQLEDIIISKNYNKYDIINIKGFISRNESLKIQKQSDLLLFLEWDDPSARGVLTGKLFEYLVSGTPILSVGISNKNLAGEVIEKTQTGKLFLEKKSLKKELKRIWKEKVIKWYNPNIKEIEKYDRNKQVDNLINIMENKI